MESRSQATESYVSNDAVIAVMVLYHLPKTYLGVVEPTNKIIQIPITLIIILETHHGLLCVLSQPNPTNKMSKYL